MGVWGKGPFDSDGAADLVSDLTKHIQRALAKGSYYYQEARAVAHILVLSHDTDILGGPSLVQVVKLLCQMRSDENYIIKWKSPRKMANVLDKEIANVLDHMRACSGCKRSGDLDKAREIVENMPVWKVPVRRVLPKYVRVVTKTRSKARKNNTVVHVKRIKSK